MRVGTATLRCVSEVDAGGFSSWLDDTLRGLADGGGIDVPCGGCTACCRSSYFIHVEPDEVETLERIPKALRFPAPGMPKGHVVLGYDEQGACPMLVEDRCSIYEHRPRTCRTYDCRVFPATGTSLDDKPLVAARAERWRFAFPTEDDRAEHDALRAVAVSIRDSTSATEAAVRAIRTYGEARVRSRRG
jgi:Fe-S-cluster containining protein